MLNMLSSCSKLTSITSLNWSRRSWLILPHKLTAFSGSKLEADNYGPIEKIVSTLVERQYSRCFC